MTVESAANNRKIKNSVRFGTVCDDYAHALDAENCENIELIRFDGEAAKDGLEAVLIR